MGGGWEEGGVLVLHAGWVGLGAWVGVGDDGALQSLCCVNAGPPVPLWCFKCVVVVVIASEACLFVVGPFHLFADLLFARCNA